MTDRATIVRNAGLARGAQLRARTHCANGHPWQPATTYVKLSGARICRICGNDSAAYYRLRRRIARDRLFRAAFPNVGL